MGKWLNGSLINATQKLLRKKRQSSEETSWKSVQGEFIQALHVGKSHWLTVSNKQCPPGTIKFCVYDSTKGAITADTNNQVAAIMHYKEVEIVLEVRSVVVIAAFMQWQQRTSFVLAMTQLASHANTINFTHTFRDA